MRTRPALGRTARVRALVSAGALILVALTTWIAPAADAQDEGGVSLTLVKQTPWTNQKHPQIDVAVLARNDGADLLENLAIRVTVWPQIYSRTQLEAVLEANPTGVVPLRSAPTPLPGDLGPSRQRTFLTSLRLDIPGVSSTQSYVYPLTIELLASDSPVAALHSAIVNFVRAPLYPMAFSWSMVLHERLLLGPDGVYQGTGLENGVLPGGRISTSVAALLSAVNADEPFAVDLIVSPPLLFQLRDMADGYSVVDESGTRGVAAGHGGAAAAAHVLDQLRTIAGSDRVELSTLTFAAATIPSLVDDFSRDLTVQLDQGARLVRTVLGVAPAKRVQHPMESQIDQASVDRLAGHGAHLLLLGPDAVPPTIQDRAFAPPPVQLLQVDSADPVEALVPNPGAQALLDGSMSPGNPTLAAQQAFAEMATIWLEQPGVAGRSLAVAAPDPEASAQLIVSLIRRFTGTPFLTPMSASRLVQEAPASSQTSALGSQMPETFSSGYAAALKQTRRKVGTYATMLAGGDTEPQRMDQTLLLAEGAQFLGNEGAGSSYVDAIDERVDGVFGDVQPIVSRLVTLTSRHGVIPVRIANTSGQTLRVGVELVSDHLSVGGGASQQLLLDQPQRTLMFDVALKTTGQFPVQVVVTAPSGRPISATTVSVRSTAYNRVALVITVAAALALLALWARRLLPSRRTS